MSWDAAMTDERAMQRILTDHAATFSKAETRERRRNGEAFTSVMWSRGWRAAVETIVPLLIHEQSRWGDLTEQEALTELRKGTGSIWWPVFRNDPTIQADCPPCGRPVVVGVEGICQHCGHTIE